MACVFVKQREGQTQLEKEEKKQETRQSSKEGRGSRAHRTSSAIVTPLFGFYSESKRGALAGIEERGTMSLLAFLRDHCGQCVEDKVWRYIGWGCFTGPGTPGQDLKSWPSVNIA